MTFEQWQKTGRTIDSDFSHLIDNAYGYVPDNCVGARMYDPGVIACIGDGTFFTHVERSEYSGALADVERALWDEYAERECRAWELLDKDEG